MTFAAPEIIMSGLLMMFSPMEGVYLVDIGFLLPAFWPEPLVFLSSEIDMWAISSFPL